MILLLERYLSTDMGTFGKLSVLGRTGKPTYRCFTVERPWADNAPNISSIPSGIYSLAETKWNQADPPLNTYQVVNVPGRTLIKFHPGNTIDDLLGCIAPGDRLGVSKGKWAVLNSRKTFQRLWQATGEGKATGLIVRSGCGATG